MDSMAKQGEMADRRKKHDLRALFEQAYEVAKPFMDPAQGVGGLPMTRYLYIALREAFPALTQQEVALLAPALRRVYQERSRMVDK